MRGWRRRVSEFGSQEMVWVSVWVNGARVAVSWTSAFLLPRAVTHFESLFSFNIEGQLARYDLHVSVSSSILEPWRAKCRDESTCKKFRWALNIALWSGIFWHGYPLRCHAAKSIRPKPKPKEHACHASH